MEGLFALRLAFPWLDGPAPAAAAAALAGTVAALALLPERLRRAALPAAALGWTAYGASPLFAATLAAAAAAHAFLLRAVARPAPRLAGALLCGVALLAASRSAPGFAGAAAWQLAALAGIRAASAALDAGPAGATAREMLLYFCGGLPASFLGAYHGFSSFRAAEGRPDPGGAADAAEGAAWLAGSALLRGALPAAAGAGAWPLAAAGFAAEGAMWLGSYRVVEGLSRLCGFAVPRQFDRPWRASSLLDFWRRYSAQNRAYLLQYALFPLLRRGWAAPAAVGAVFALSAGLNALRFAGVFLEGGADSALGAATSFALFFACFGALAALESALRPAPPATAGGRLLRRAAVALAVVWLWAPLLRMEPPSTSTPARAAAAWRRAAGGLLALGGAP